MSVILKGEAKSELPLITFTTCVPAAEGAALCALLAGSPAGAAALAALLTTIGMIASIGHLAKPLRAPRSLANLASSWLSREIIVVSLFWGLLLIWLVTALGTTGMLPSGAEASWAVLAFGADLAAVAVGALLLFVIARAYHVSTRPAWCSWEGLAELWACALATGPVGVMLSSGPDLSAGAIPWALTVALPLAGLLVDVLACRKREQRLSALATVSDERIPLTLERYRRLMPRLRKLWGAEGGCVAASVLALVCWAALDAAAMAWGLLLAAFCGQLVIHGAIRAIFYDLPVQVRFVGRLRK